jgi:hypothetical protein
VSGDIHIRLDDSGPAGELLGRVMREMVARRERPSFHAIRAAVRASGAPGEAPRGRGPSGRRGEL